MSGEISLHVEFGPVVPFIAEARRTRDSWAGSYILSYLMARALLAAEGEKATIIYPSMDNSLIQMVRTALAGKPPKPSGVADRVGSLPDRFEASTTDAAHAERVAIKATAAWQSAWRQLAGHVWEYLEAQGWPATPETESIWDRQIGTPEGGGPWTIRWTVGPYEDHNRRWQFYPFQDIGIEEGEMSTLGGARAALSGASLDRRDVRNFWTKVSRKVGPYNVRSGGRERLDAVGAVKRFLPLTDVAYKALGWPVPTSYPSTRTIATGPWLRAVLARPDDQSLTKQVKDVAEWLQLAGVPRLNGRELNRGLVALATAHSVEAGLLLNYDGDVYDPEGDEVWEEIVGNEGVAEARVEIRQLIQLAQGRGIASPRTHFALLAMDGDRLGNLLSSRSSAKVPLSTALGEFSQGVPDIVEDDQALGRMIYAGGDDVLAFLPIETALATAERIRRWYQHCLRDLADDTWQPTISAAVLYAPVATPLRVLVRSAHDLLEYTAKGERELGRDAFAVEVWTGGGPILCVGRPWESRDATDATCEHSWRWSEEIAWATEEARAGDESRARGLTSKFLYRLRPTLEVIQPDGQPALSEGQQVDILLAEDLKTRRDADVDPVEERTRIERLARLLRRRSNAKAPQHNGALEWGMARFVRFLAEEEA